MHRVKSTQPKIPPTHPSHFPRQKPHHPRRGDMTDPPPPHLLPHSPLIHPSIQYRPKHPAPRHPEHRYRYRDPPPRHWKSGTAHHRLFMRDSDTRTVDQGVRAPRRGTHDAWKGCFRVRDCAWFCKTRFLFLWCVLLVAFFILILMMCALLGG